ncbi:MAG: SRPBCC family protein [Anaerolineae bacterium]
MKPVEHSVVVQAPLEQVFAYTSDYRKWPEWYTGVGEATPTTQTTRGNGTRYAYKARMMGMWAAVETEIHDFEENRGWTGVGTKGLPHRTHWTFEPLGTGTRFTHAVECTVPVPLLGPLLEGLLRPEWERILSSSLTNLQRHFQSP